MRKNIIENCEADNEVPQKVVITAKIHSIAFCRYLLVAATSCGAFSKSRVFDTIGLMYCLLYVT